MQPAPSGLSDLSNKAHGVGKEKWWGNREGTGEKGLRVNLIKTGYVHLSSY